MFGRIADMPTVQLKYQTFHPSIWPKMIGEASRDATPGAFVQVLGKSGDPFGWGFWNPKSRMPLRLVSHSVELLDEKAFFEQAIRNAANLRRNVLKLDERTETYRAIHGDADFMPGIVADKFADVLSVEITNLAAWMRLPEWLPQLHEAFGTRRLVLAVDPDLARVEGIPRHGGPVPDAVRSVKLRECGLRYEIDFSSGHKTGFFCDQRENRQQFGRLAEGRRVLDLCSYTGGFSLAAAAAGAEEVTAVDLDETAVEMAKRNANLNNLKVKFTHADVFTWIRTMIENQRKWDLILVDPPKFMHGREDETGIAKYADLNRLALQLLESGGLYVTCSCSGQLGSGEFERIVTHAAHRQDKRMQIFDRTGAGADHPTLSNYPESRYLKVLWSRVMG